MSVLEKLTSSLEEFQFEVNKVLVERNQELTKLSAVLEEIELDMEQNISKTLEVLENTSKGLGFTLSIVDLTSEEQFQFNG